MAVSSSPRWYDPIIRFNSLNKIHLISGHGGTETAEYAASNLPGRIHATLREAVLNATQTIDPVSVSNILSSQVELFDQEIGNDVKRICPKPRRLDEAEVQALIDGPEGHILRRANAGTTFAAALIDGERKNLWIVGLGDSSVGL
jgi:pyruvate dehydrogenase phosphatase